MLGRRKKIWRQCHGSGVQLPASHCFSLLTHPRLFHMGFVVDEAALGQVFSEYFDFYLYVLFHKCPVFIHLSPKPYNLSNSFNNATLSPKRKIIYSKYGIKRPTYKICVRKPQWQWRGVASQKNGHVNYIFAKVAICGNLTSLSKAESSVKALSF